MLYKRQAPVECWHDISRQTIHVLSIRCPSNIGPGINTAIRNTLVTHTTITVTNKMFTYVDDRLMCVKVYVIVNIYLPRRLIKRPAIANPAAFSVSGSIL